MQWKITTGSDRANANAQTLDGTEGRPVFVDVVHPGVGPDARVRIIDVTTQRTVADLSCGFTDQGPKRAEFSPVASGSRSYNLIVDPAGATFGDPGIAINANATSPESEVPYVVDPATGGANFSGPIDAPTVTTQTISSLGPVLARPAHGVSIPLILGEPPISGVWSINGSSTVANSAASGGDGTDASLARSPFEYANQLMGAPYVLKYHGYSGQTNAVIAPAIPVNAVSDGATTTIIQMGANDLDNTEASAVAAFEAVKTVAIAELIAGRYPLIHTPHAKQSGILNSYGVGRYSILVEEWAAQIGLRIVRADYALDSKATAVGTAVSNSMADESHVNSYGAALIGAEYKRALVDKIRYRIGAVGYNAAYKAELIANPHCTGTGGTNGTGSSGTVSAGFTSVRGSGTATCVCSKGTDADGDYQDLTITFGAAGERWDYLAVDSAATLNGRKRASTKYVQMADVDIVSGPVKRVTLIASLANKELTIPIGPASSAWSDTAMSTGRRMLRTRAIDPAVTGDWTNAPQLMISSSAAGAAVVRVRGISVRETVTLDVPQGVSPVSNGYLPGQAPVFSGFTPLYVAGAPQVADLTVESSQSQRVAIPAGSSTIRLTFQGYGPFRYRLGNSTVAALATDSPAFAEMQILVPVGTATHIAVYGVGAGSLVIEGGTGGD